MEVRAVSSEGRRSFLERYPIGIYYVITFAVTIVLGGAYQFTQNAFVSPQYAPTIGLIAIGLLSKKWDAWKKINWGLSVGYKDTLWLFAALLLPLSVILGSSLVMSSLGERFVPWHDTAGGCVLTVVTTILGCIFEEIGWRGYLLPKFRERQTAFRSALAVGLLWGIWHCRFESGVLGFVLFVSMITCFSVLMTWIYTKTKGNLLCMMVFHLGINAGGIVLLQQRIGALFYGLSTVVGVLIVALILIADRESLLEAGLGPKPRAL